MLRPQVNWTLYLQILSTYMYIWSIYNCINLYQDVHLLVSDRITNSQQYQRLCSNNTVSSNTPNIYTFESIYSCTYHQKYTFYCIILSILLPSCQYLTIYYKSKDWTTTRANLMLAHLSSPGFCLRLGEKMLF